MGTINKITRHFGWADHRLTSAVNSVNNVPTCTRKLKRKRALFVKMGGQRWPYLKGQDNEVVVQRACKRCRHPMSRVAEIAPFGGGPGLVAFMCTNCSTTDSVLVQPHTARARTTDGTSAAAVNCYLPPLIWF
jgi:hypothetical protein